MADIVVGHWYKYKDPHAFGKVDAIKNDKIRVIFDNGFKAIFKVEEFWIYFETNKECERMNK